MPVYDVAMGQAAATHNMEGNTLSTGNQESRNFLSSCAAVILISDESLRAGLYHYPAGDITLPGRRPMQELLQDMAAYVRPTLCHVVYGTTDLVRNPFGSSNHPSDEHHGKLLGFLRTLRVGLQLQARPASSSCAWVTMTDGAFVVGTQRLSASGIKNLDGETPGIKTWGRTYGPGHVRRAPPGSSRGKCIIL